MPPALPLAVLPLAVLFFSVSVPELEMPPPKRAALLSLTVLLFISVNVP